VVLRAIFANKDPLIAFHLLKKEIPYSTLLEFVEYLDVFEAMKEHAETEARKKAESANAGNKKRNL
jgi:hypothetical protein